MRLDYNEETDTISNSPGVEMRIPGNFGDTEPAEYLDPSLKMSTSVYFGPIVDALIEKGYQRRKSVFAAAYDFRLAPSSNDEYRVKTVQLIEQAYELNNQTGITLISHSMGGAWTQYILGKQSKQWKNKYIKLWISINGVFGGTVKMMKVLASGDNEGVKTVTGRDARIQQRTFESNFWLMPSPLHWDASQVLVQTPQKNFTVRDYDEFFKAVNYPVGSKLRKRVENLQSEAPEVPLLLLYGSGLDTIERVIYENGFEADPVEVQGDGDGTVNRKSLEAPLIWRTLQNEPISSKNFPGGCHNCLLSNHEVRDMILNSL